MNKAQEILRQLVVASAVANLYGHEWANTDEDTLVSASQIGTLADACKYINDKTMRRFWERCGIDPDNKHQQEKSLYHGALGAGICGPKVNDVWDTSLYHRTREGTGRVEIIIYTGSTEVAIMRPNGQGVGYQCISAKVDPYSYEVYVIYRGAMHARHLGALAEVVQVIEDAYKAFELASGAQCYA